MIYRRLIKEWFVAICIALIIALFINKLFFFKIIVPTESMYSTINAGDQIIVNRISKNSSIKRGDIIVFFSKEFNELLVKRVVGLPGETVEIKETGQIYIDNKKLIEPYVKNNETYKGTFLVPENYYFLLGDNRSNSIDSRKWNNPYIDRSDIIGKAKLIVYPLIRIHILA